MNLGNSKLFKSSKQMINRSAQTVTTYSCELYIDTFKISYRGFVYFSWSSNNSQINSLRYESTGKLVQVKETLTIGVRISSKNGKEEQLDTRLKLITESGEQLDECQIIINHLTTQYKEMEIPMDRGLVNLKTRRKQMKIGEQQDLSYQGLYRSKSKIKRIDQKSFANSSQIEFLQQELNKKKKQLEDQIYLNNKLKNDRDVLLATKQQLQLQIQSMVLQISNQITILREYYEKRIVMRDHSYEQEIEEMVNLFNSNAEQSRKVIDVIMKQKIKMEEDIKPLSEKIKQLDADIVQGMVKFDKLQSEKQQLEANLFHAQQSILSKEKQIDQLNREKGELKSEVNSLAINIENLHAQIEKHKQVKNNSDNQLAEMDSRIHELEFQLQNKDLIIHQFETDLIHSKQREEGLQRQKQLTKKGIESMEVEKKGLISQIQNLRQKLEQFEYEMEFNENVITQLKKRNNQDEYSLLNKLQSLDQMYSAKIEDIKKAFNLEKEQLVGNARNLSGERQQLIHKIQTLQHDALVSTYRLAQMQKQFNKLTSQIENSFKQVDSKDQKIAQLDRQISRLTNELQQLKSQQFSKKQLEHQLKIAEEVIPSTKQLQASNKQLGEKIIILNAQVKRLTDLLQQSKSQSQTRFKELKKAEEKIEKIHDKSEVNKTEPAKSQKQDASDKKGFNREEVKQIVVKKQREIGELRTRVDYLQNLYDQLKSKFEEIGQKYPQVDLEELGVNNMITKIVECCDSEQEQERLINRLNDPQAIDQLDQPRNSQNLQNGHEQNQDTIQPIQKRQPKKKKILKRNTFADAIQEHDQQQDRFSVTENSGVSKRRSFENVPVPRSKPNSHITRKESGESRFVQLKIELPRSPSLKKQHSHGSFEPSEKSCTSYVKVSHTKKIRELQNLIEELIQKQKQYQNQIKSNLKTAQELKKQLQESKIQLDGVNKKYNENEEKLNQRESMINELNAKEKMFRESKESLVMLEEERLKTFMHESQIKELEIQKMHLRLGELEDLVKTERTEAAKELAALEMKLLQNKQKEEQNRKKQSGLHDANKNLAKEIAETEQKLRKEKENAQQMRLKNKEISLQFENAEGQLKKAKNIIQTLEQKAQKMAGSDSAIKELSKEIEDYNKKTLEQTRNINHLKLQKDSIEQELRILKKKQNEQLRIVTEWEEKTASLQRAIEEMKRKENKLKREIEEAQEQVRRSKMQVKKAEEQLQALVSAQITWQVERRKYLDEISNLQDQLSRKDYEYNKLSKEVDKWKMRAEEKEELRMGKKSQMREEINRLEAELIRKEKKVLEETEQNKLLRQRLQMLERQNKRIMQQKNQTYGQKLKYYVEQMSNIKKLLEEYQNENNRLKIENNELYEQAEIIRMNYDKLEIKYDDNIDREESILNDLQSYINEASTLKDRLDQSHAEISQLESAYTNLRKQADQQKLQLKKTVQKLQASQKNNERAQTEIRELKVKLSQLETNNEINGKINERYRQLERKKHQLDQQHRRLKVDYDNVISAFIFKRQDLQKAVADARNHQKRMKQEETQMMNEQFSKSIAAKTQRLEQQILDLYNENSKFRSENQILKDEHNKQKNKLTENQTIILKLTPLQSENEMNKQVISQLKEEIKKRTEKQNRLDLTLQAMQMECNSKDKDLISCKNRMQELEKDIDKLNYQIQSRRHNERELQDALLKAGQIKEQEKSAEDLQARQRQSRIIQEYEAKFSNYELQLQRAKDREERSYQQNSSKMKKLEEKIDEMEQALKEREKAIQSHYQLEMRQAEDSLTRLSQQFQQKLARIEELNQAVIILEGEVKDVTKENQQIRYQYDEQKEISDGQIDRLKNKLKQLENTYANNLRSLEEEVSKASQIKNGVTGSRVKVGQFEERIAKRFEEKLKNKDKKIEELKQNIYTLEETIIKLRKKQSTHQSTLIELERLKIFINDSEKQRRSLQIKYEDEFNRSSDSLRDLKRQILLIKQNEEKYKLLTEEKIMENQSILCELKTMRELYSDLQRQLERRKDNLANQIEEENSLHSQLRSQENKIVELEEKVIELMKYNKDLEVDAKKKTLQIRRYLETVQQFKKFQQKANSQIVRYTNEISKLQKSLQQSIASCDSLKAQIRQNKGELVRLRKNYQEIKASSLIKQQCVVDLKRMNEEMSLRYRESEEAASRYHNLNESCRSQLGCGIQQVVDKFISSLEQRDAEINQLIEETEELKFLNQRKFIDYDELKKENIELQIKAEDVDVLNDQLDTLRKICDKLEDEKKNSVFREEVMRMHLQNLANNGAPDLRSRIQAILGNQSLPSYTNFSFY